jgi:hypothetical protein
VNRVPAWVSSKHVRPSTETRLAYQSCGSDAPADSTTTPPPRTASSFLVHRSSTTRSYGEPERSVRTGEALLEHYASDSDQHHRSTSPLHLEPINPALVLENQVKHETVAAGAEHQGPHVPARVVSTQRLPTPRGTSSTSRTPCRQQSPQPARHPAWPAPVRGRGPRTPVRLEPGAPATAGASRRPILCRVVTPRCAASPRHGPASLATSKLIVILWGSVTQCSVLTSASRSAHPLPRPRHHHHRSRRGIENFLSIGRLQAPRAESRRTRPFHARGSAAHPGSAGWHVPPPRRSASRTPGRSPRHGSSGRPPPSPDP